ncbi:MAG: response regulator transcription factor [Bdellovibrionales bacterium]|nr:response regulator transcription factor [Bdellovibrionales bacterium]
MKILIVEDEDLLRANLASYLKQQNFQVETATNAQEGLYHAGESNIDLGIFDLGLPDFSGIELIQKLRKKNIQFPILILTARNAWEDKVDGLEAGADDYVVKPFQKEEIMARIRALLRRSVGQSKPIIEHGNFALDPKSASIKFHDKELELTAYEYKILEYFLYHPKEVVSKAKLMLLLYGDESDRDPNIIEVFIRRLRKKTQGKDTKKQSIRTMRGQGYIFDGE